jgi:anti-sigma factor RsiW
MTPQLTLHISSPHLTEDQFGELLAGTSGPALESAKAHLLACEECASELAGLRDSVSLFRQASNAYADHELRSLPPVSLPTRGVLSPALTPTYWLAAAALFLAAILPMQSLRQHTFRAAPAVSAGTPESASQSDEALLEDVDSYTSASVPAPLQALADPNLSSTGITATNQNSDQRKD